MEWGSKITFILIYTAICLGITLLFGLFMKIAITVLLIRLAIVFGVSTLVGVGVFLLLELYFPNLLNSEVIVNSNQESTANRVPGRQVDISINDNYKSSDDEDLPADEVNTQNLEEQKIDGEIKQATVENTNVSSTSTDIETGVDNEDNSVVKNDIDMNSSTVNNSLNINVNKHKEAQNASKFENKNNSTQTAVTSQDMSSNFSAENSLIQHSQTPKKTGNYATLDRAIDFAQKKDTEKEDKTFIALNNVIEKTERVIEKEPAKVAGALRSLFNKEAKKTGS